MNILIIFQKMAIFIYIFIFLLLSFGSIESKGDETEPIKFGLVISVALFNPFPRGCFFVGVSLSKSKLWWILNITILNYVGMVTRNLVNDIPTSRNDLILYDSLNIEFQNVQSMIWVLNIPFFNLNGRYRKERRVCTVSDRFVIFINLDRKLYQF